MTGRVDTNSILSTDHASSPIRLSRRFRLGGSRALEAIIEAFNLFDRTNFSQINNVFGRGA